MRGEQELSDVEDWEQREASRTHSVKFSDIPTLEKETPFIRQNTPHPKELKAKAQKLLAKSRQEDQTLLSSTANQAQVSDSNLAAASTTLHSINRLSGTLIENNEVNFCYKAFSSLIGFL